MLVLSPSDVFEQCEDVEGYFNALRQIAVHYDNLRSDKVLLNALRKSKFLLGRRRLPEVTNAVSNGNTTFADDTDLLTESWELAKADEIDIADDPVLDRIFKPLSAPQEPLLEEFYEALGSVRISSKVKESYRLHGHEQTSTFSDQLFTLIQERLPLLFFEVKGRVRIARSPEDVLKYLKIVEYNRIDIIREKEGIRHVEAISACILSSSSRAIKLCICRTDFDYHDVATALSRVTFGEIRRNEAFLLGSLLSNSLSTLRRKGFPVERVIQTQKSARNAKLIQKAKESAEESKTKSLEEMFPEATKEELLNALYDAKDDVQVAADTLLQQKKQEQRESFTNDRDGGIVKDESVKGFLSRFSKRMSNFVAGTVENELQKTKTIKPITQQQVVHDVDPKSTERLRETLSAAVKSCKPFQLDTLRSDMEIKTVTESASNYCDAVPAKDLIFVHKVGSADLKTSFYINQKDDSLEIRSDKSLETLANDFSQLLQNLGSIFGLDPASIHIFYDRTGTTIAFNRNRSLFFNLRFYQGLHSQGTLPAFEVAAYWFMTFCHELAHNFVLEHSSQHEFYMSSFAESYLRAFVTKFSK